MWPRISVWKRSRAVRKWARNVHRLHGIYWKSNQKANRLLYLALRPVSQKAPPPQRLHLLLLWPDLCRLSQVDWDSVIVFFHDWVHIMLWANAGALALHLSAELIFSSLLKLGEEGQYRITKNVAIRLSLGRLILDVWSSDGLPIRPGALIALGQKLLDMYASGAFMASGFAAAGTGFVFFLLNIV